MDILTDLKLSDTNLYLTLKTVRSNISLLNGYNVGPQIIRDFFPEGEINVSRNRNFLLGFVDETVLIITPLSWMSPGIAMKQAKDLMKCLVHKHNASIGITSPINRYEPYIPTRYEFKYILNAGF